MANARPRDTRAGWEIYRTTGFRATRDEINESLTAAGYGPISGRSYEHYKSLAAAGYDHYISINRFDVARASRQYEGNSANSRYSYRASSVGARVTFARRNDIYEEFGIAERLSETGAVVRFDDPVGQHVRDAKLSAGDSIRIQFVDPPMSSAGRVVDVAREDGFTEIEIEFTRLHSIADYVASDELPATRFRLVLEAQDDEDKPADLVGRRVYFTLELLESVRAVVNEYLASNDHLEYAAPATIERLRVESPQDLIANVPAIVGSISLMCLGILGPIRAYQSIRLKRADVDTRQQDARVRRAEADVAEAKAALEVEIYQTLRSSLGEGQTTDRLLALTRQQLLPAVESLAAQEVEGAHQAELPDRAT